MTKTLIIVLFLLLTSLNKAQPIGPVAKYTFNEGTVKDEVNNTYGKGVSVLFIEDRFGNPSSAVYFHGTPESYVNLGTSEVLKPRYGTVAMWVNIDLAMYGGKGVESNPIIICKNNNGLDFCEAYSFGYDYNTKRMITTTNESDELQVRLVSKDTFALRQWHHLAACYNDDSLYLYINGVLNAKTGKHFRTVFSKTDSVTLATYASPKNVRSYCGRIDDIFIYNRVLSPDEVYALYTAPNPNRNQRYLSWALKILAGLALIGFMTWFIYLIQKKKFEKAKEINRINSKLLELETKSVRSQMNPHFIFNSLNTLQRFILQHDFENSHLYLSKFSVLLRKLLETSSSDYISLKDEKNILDLYLSIEKLRFSNIFEFKIESDISNEEKTFIPFMLVQPFVENAIWHGLLHKEGDCLLQLSFEDIDERRLKCIVDDNGVGLQASKSKGVFMAKKSMGIELIKQRLTLLESSTGVPCHIKITEKKYKNTNASEGTRVELIIPKLNYN
jgi:hypothetical protein